MSQSVLLLYNMNIFLIEINFAYILSNKINISILVKKWSELNSKIDDTFKYVNFFDDRKIYKIISV